MQRIASVDAVLRQRLLGAEGDCCGAQVAAWEVDKPGAAAHVRFCGADGRSVIALTSSGSVQWWDTALLKVRHAEALSCLGPALCFTTGCEQRAATFELHPGRLLVACACANTVRSCRSLSERWTLLHIVARTAPEPVIPSP